jgi:hypothetical protein
LIGQVVLDRIAKYLLLPGFDLDINIMGKVSAAASRILYC